MGPNVRLPFEFQIERTIGHASLLKPEVRLSTAPNLLLWIRQCMTTTIVFQFSSKVATSLLRPHRSALFSAETRILSSCYADDPSADIPDEKI